MSASTFEIAENAILAPSGLDEGRLTRVLDTVLSRGVDYADLYFELSHEESWSLEDGIVKDGSHSIEQGVGVRAISGEKTGFAYTDEVLLPALVEASDAARAIARSGASNAVKTWQRPPTHRLYLPIDPLELTLGVGNQNAKITEAGSALSPQREGDPVFEVPDWTGNASAAWTTRFADDYKLVAETDYSYVGHSFSANNLVNVNGVFETRLRPHYDLVNSRIALSHGKMEYAFVGKNLANEAANLGDNRSLAAETPGRPRLIVNQPRTFGIEVRASF